MQMLILEFVSAEDSFDLGGSGGLATESYHPQRGSHHHGGDEDVLHAFLLCHIVVEAGSKSQRRLFAYKCLVFLYIVMFKPKPLFLFCNFLILIPEGQIGAVVSQCGSMTAQLLVLCRGHKGQKAQSYNASHPHPVRLQKQLWQPVKGEGKSKSGLALLHRGCLTLNSGSEMCVCLCWKAEYLLKQGFLWVRIGL